jgi:hypothetical protein
MFEFLDNGKIILNLIIKHAVPAQKVEAWKSILDIINKPVHHDLIELLNDKCKGEIYEYINNIKAHYLKYKQSELDSIVNEYNKYKTEYLQDLYLVYKIPNNLTTSIEYMGNAGHPYQDTRKELMTTQDLILEDISSIVKRYALESYSTGTLLFVKKQGNQLSILNSTSVNLDKFSLAVSDIKNISIINPDSTDFIDIEVRMRDMESPTKLSNFYIIAFSDLVKSYEVKKYIFKYDEPNNKFYLYDGELNEPFYYIDFIKQKVLLKQVSIDSNMPYVELYELDDILDCAHDNYIIWCVAHRGYDVINYGVGVDGYIMKNGYHIDSYDYEYEYYKPELIKRYLASDPKVIIYWDSFLSKGISKEQLELYMREYMKSQNVGLSPNYDFNKNYPGCLVVEYHKNEEWEHKFIELKIFKIHKSGLQEGKYSYNNHHNSMTKYLEGKSQHVIINKDTFPPDSNPDIIISYLYDPKVKYMITLYKHKVRLLEKYSNYFKFYTGDEDVSNYINKFLEADTEYVLDIGELGKNIPNKRIKECLVKNASLYEEYEAYIENFKDKYIIGFALKAMFGQDANYIDREDEEYNIYNELYVYKNGKIIKNEDGLYVEIINKWKGRDESIVLDEWSFLAKFYDSGKFIDEYLGYIKSKN